MYKVFISHAPKDAPLARKIKDRIEEVGAEAWLDSVEPDFGAGFVQTIHDRLRKSDEVLVVATGQSVRNFWVNGEVGAAVALGKKIVPVMDHVELSDLPPVLHSADGVDVSNLDRYLAQLISRIKAHQKDATPFTH